jgi:hypothetical protein
MDDLEQRRRLVNGSPSIREARAASPVAKIMLPLRTPEGLRIA